MGSDGRILINPSILNANFDDLENEISKVSEVSDALHLDIMDNKFDFIKNTIIPLFIKNGDWGLGIGDWGLGPIPNPQSPIPKITTIKY